MSRNYILITLDSCRYDTYMNADTPNFDRVGTVYKAFSNGNFTFASHMAMFVGFTPGNPEYKERFINPKYGRIFRLKRAGFRGCVDSHIVLRGKNIIAGFKHEGYKTIGVGAMAWFNDAKVASRPLIEKFDHFLYTGTDIDQQIAFVMDQLQKYDDEDVFVFMNIGETHTPYHYNGAEWDKTDNSCVSFAQNNSKKKSTYRQRKCLEYIDQQIKPVLEYFKNDNIVICADHGDCWGEDGLWGHGIHHEKTVTVPLIYQLQ